MSLLFATHSFTTEVLIQAAPAAVLAAIADTPAYIRLNPLVVDVRRAQGEADTYLVVDSLRFLGVPFRIRYEVRAARIPDGFAFDVHAGLATRLHNEALVRAEGTGARVRETARMTTLRPLARYALATAQVSHRDLLDRLKRRVESGA